MVSTAVAVQWLVSPCPWDTICKSRAYLFPSYGRYILHCMEQFVVTALLLVVVFIFVLVRVVFLGALLEYKTSRCPPVTGV